MTRFLGIDLGGTNIKGVILELPDGDLTEARVVAEARVPTQASQGPDVVMEGMAELGRQLMAAHGPVHAAGVAVPGLYDAGAGTIVLFPNLPGPWLGQPLPARLSQAWGVPTALINDARAFTLAEVRMGAAAGRSTVVCVTLGTGIGGGVVIDGRLRSGPHGRAGEVGHQVIMPGGPPCGCGNEGCLESLAKAEVLAAAAGTATAREAYDAARAGDPTAQAAVEAVAGHLGHALGNLVTVLIPERIVIGGGIADAGEILLAPLRQAIAATAVLVPADWYEVVPASLGSRAGAMGAALWAAESPQ
ncbi:MAG TPA: ROK family protein [Dermatophilaceae bacterium]|nr:ROK family protein [Dermatophilaceae bacterium]